jgi:hypothetical protein
MFGLPRRVILGVYYLTPERARSLKVADINSGPVRQGAAAYAVQNVQTVQPVRAVQQFTGSRFNAI